MDIRTRLALALVSISLVSMFVLGMFAYQTSKDLLRQDSERKLDALAESKQRDLEKVIAGWRDRVELIRSRTRLRELVDRSASRSDDDVDMEIRRILRDAIGSVRGLERVTLVGADGSKRMVVGDQRISFEAPTIALSDPARVHYAGTEVLAGREVSPGTANRAGTSALEDGRVVVRFHAALRREGRTIGAIETIIDAEDLLTVTRDFSGLGESGESFVFTNATSEGAGRVRVLNPLRHDAEGEHLFLDSTPHLAAALNGDETVFQSGVTDYRGAEVWCATRSLADVGWGLVVKIDSAEESLRASWLLDQMIDLGLSLGAIAILGGTFLGFRLGRPLRDLTEIVERIRGGEQALRADATAPDEVGFLAEALNDLLDEVDTR